MKSTGLIRPSFGCSQRTGLKARELLGRQVDDRLVEDLELVLARAPAQIAFERDALVAVGAHLGREDLDAIGTAALGAAHGDLGLLEQV